MKRLIFLVLAILCLTTSSASAADNFGPWYPTPGGAGSSKYYQSYLTPFSSEDNAEIADFGCFGPDGRDFSAKERDVLSKIFQDASAAYYGKLYKDGDAETENAQTTAFGSGTLGMRNFLDHQYMQLASGWDQYSVKGDGYEQNEGTDSGGGTIFPQLQPFIPAPSNRTFDVRSGAIPMPTAFNNISGIDGKAGAASPAELSMLIDPGCNINPINAQDAGGLGSFLKNPGDWIAETLVAIPTRVVSSLYEVVQPYAFRFTFFTPHSERGDTFWNIAPSCSESYVGNNSAREEKVQDSCTDGAGAGSVPLGFSTERLDVKNQNSFYLTMSHFLQWMVSAVYFLLLFTSALVYMVRGSRSTNFNVIQLIPRLMLSAFATIIAPSLIGLAITTSNTFVQTMFDAESGASIGAFSDVLRMSSSVTGSGEDFASQLVQLIVGGFTTFYFFFFVMFSVIRQLLLIALIVVTPLAMFCLLIPKWQPRFQQWLKGITFVIFAPAVLAFILKLGLSVNPMLTELDGGQGLNAMLGIAVTLATLWLMAKVLKTTVSATVGAQIPGMTGKMLSQAGGAMTGLGQGTGAGAALMRGAGRATSVAGAAAEASDAALVPKGRQLGAFGEGIGGGLESLLGGGGGGRGGRGGGLMGALKGGGMGYGGSSWLESKIMERNAMDGTQQVSGRMATNARVARARAVKEASLRAERTGTKLSRADKKAFLQQYDAEHGQYTRRGRNWVRTSADPDDSSRWALEHRAAIRDYENSTGRKPNMATRRQLLRDLDIHHTGAPQTGYFKERMANRVRQSMPGMQPQVPKAMMLTPQMYQANAQPAARLIDSVVQSGARAKVMTKLSENQAEFSKKGMCSNCGEEQLLLGTGVCYNCYNSSLPQPTADRHKRAVPGTQTILSSPGTSPSPSPSPAPTEPVTHLVTPEGHRTGSGARQQRQETADEWLQRRMGGDQY